MQLLCVSSTAIVHIVDEGIHMIFADLYPSNNCNHLRWIRSHGRHCDALIIFCGNLKVHVDYEQMAPMAWLFEGCTRAGNRRTLDRQDPISRLVPPVTLPTELEREDLLFTSFSARSTTVLSLLIKVSNSGSGAM